jgi:hypothetical protein
MSLPLTKLGRSREDDELERSRPSGSIDRRTVIAPGVIVPGWPREQAGAEALGRVRRTLPAVALRSSHGCDRAAVIALRLSRGRRAAVIARL